MVPIRCISMFLLFVALAGIRVDAAIDSALFKPGIAATKYSAMDVPVYTIDAVALFGADSTGLNDASGAIQQALDTARARYGGIVYLSEGKYLVKKPLSIPTSVTLRGDWKRPTALSKTVAGTILLIDHGAGSDSVAPAITLGQASCVRDLSIYYPKQNVRAPVVYPWTFFCESQNSPNIRNVTLVNSYQGIYFAGGLISIKGCQAQNVYGAPLFRGLYFNNDQSHPRLVDINFKPEYWGESGLDAATTSLVKSAMRSLKSIGISLGEAPGAHSIVGLQIAGYDIGLLQFSSYGGRMFDFKITDCRIGMEFQASGTNGFSITSGEVHATQKAVWMHASGSLESVQFNNVTFSSDKYLIEHSSGVLGFTRCTFQSWDSGYAVESFNHSISITGNVFKKGGNAILLGDSVDQAVVYANQFEVGTPSIQVKSRSSNIVVDVTSKHQFVELDTIKYPFIHVQKQPPSVPPGRSRLFNVRDYGAKGTGLAGDDDTKAFQDALNAAGALANASSGAVVFVPVGVFRLDGRLTVPGFVELRGIHDYRFFGHGAASILLLYAGKNNPTSGAIITLSPNSGIKGLYLFRPEQTYDAQAGITTVYPYPFAVRGSDRNWVYNLVLGNLYDGIDFSAGGGHHVEGLYACAINRVLEIRGDGETSVVEAFSAKHDPFFTGRNDIVVPEWTAAFTAGNWRPPIASGLQPGLYDKGVGITTRGNGTFRFMGHFMNGTGTGGYEIYGSPTINMYCAGGEMPDRTWTRGTYIESNDNADMDLEMVGGTMNNDLGAGFTISNTNKGDRLHRINCKGYPGAVNIGHTFKGGGHLVLQQEFRLGNHDISLKLENTATAVIESGWYNGNTVNIANVSAEGENTQAKICGTMSKGNSIWTYLPADEKQICVKSVSPPDITGISGMGGGFCSTGRSHASIPGEFCLYTANAYKNRIVINFSNPYKNLSLTLVTLKGQVVRKYPHQKNNKLVISTRSLPGGTYIARIVTGNSAKSFKFVVHK